MFSEEAYESIKIINRRFNINFLNFSQEANELVAYKEYLVYGKECLEWIKH